MDFGQGSSNDVDIGQGTAIILERVQGCPRCSNHVVFRSVAGTSVLKNGQVGLRVWSPDGAYIPEIQGCLAYRLGLNSKNHTTSNRVRCCYQVVPGYNYCSDHLHLIQVHGFATFPNASLQTEPEPAPQSSSWGQNPAGRAPSYQMPWLATPWSPPSSGQPGWWPILSQNAPASQPPPRSPSPEPPSRPLPPIPQSTFAPPPPWFALQPTAAPPMYQLPWSSAESVPQSHHSGRSGGPQVTSIPQHGMGYPGVWPGFSGPRPSEFTEDINSYRAMDGHEEGEN
ncbi:hypothetical protein M231_05295 [Tremella mesenterica]|uniref:Uncharacterized protein n=1 Tax=Tremella mesenterica TaxID=5217 RepID=A0A4Q1BIR0_TREME|nr:hypothetical protein M231_05295 [Tremella mesenterica]